MSAIVTELLTGITAIWMFMVTTFVPASASAVTLVHFGLWGGLIFGFATQLLSMVRHR